MLAIRQDWLNCVAPHLQYALELFQKFWDIGSLNSLLQYPWTLLCVSPSYTKWVLAHSNLSIFILFPSITITISLCDGAQFRYWTLMTTWISSTPSLTSFLWNYQNCELGYWNLLCLFPCTQIVQKENTQKSETTEVNYLFNLKWVMFVIIFRIFFIDHNCLENQYIFTLTMNSKGKTSMNLQYQKPLWGSRNNR